MTKPNTLKTWMVAASVDEQDALAKLAGTTRGTLYQYVGNRKPSAERAIALEEASKEMSKRTKGRLPIMYRTDLATACSQCQFARKCIGPKSEFEIVGEGK